jgi:hypothetical protein
MDSAAFTVNVSKNASWRGKNDNRVLWDIAQLRKKKAQTQYDYTVVDLWYNKRATGESGILDPFGWVRSFGARRDAKRKNAKKKSKTEPCEKKSIQKRLSGALYGQKV